MSISRRREVVCGILNWHVQESSCSWTDAPNSISLLVSVHKYVPGFNIFAGAFLGVCAGLLWTAQGTIMMSYPMEQSKGRYFAWFWGIFNVGACIGSLVSDDALRIGMRILRVPAFTELPALN